MRTVLICLGVTCCVMAVLEWWVARCPKCRSRMTEVYGWNKAECPACGFTETF